MAIMHSCHVFILVESKLEFAQQVLDQLATKSAALNLKVGKIEKYVGDLKCGFSSLIDDVTVLESARSELLALATTELSQHDNAAESEFSELLNSLEEKKEKVSIIKDYTHPCGGAGWDQVEYLDFRDSSTTCPSPLTTLTMFTERPYTCGLQSVMISTCELLTIPLNSRKYSKVCGRIRAYQYGTPNGFASGQTINEPYLSGVSLTHGGNLASTAIPATHIWSFASGITQVPSGDLPMSRCPCDGGSSSPDFVGEDYFCESAIEQDVQSGNINQFDLTFHFRNLLWDGERCGDSSECCSRIDHPYFIKTLEASTMDDIDLRVCISDGSTEENVAIELIELYVQ